LEQALDLVEEDSEIDAILALGESIQQDIEA